MECRAGGPLAGLSSVQILQVSTHLAAIRAGTIHDGQFQHRESIQRYLPSGMVDPHSERAAPTSTAEPVGQRILRNIRRPRHTLDASAAQADSHNQQLSHIPKSIDHPHIETRGWAQRIAPTQSLFYPSRQQIHISQIEKTKTLPAASRHREGPIVKKPTYQTT